MSVTITSGELEATFVPKLAMVGASLTHRREELLGMGNGVEGYRDRASTFGIPLLHPWANRLDIPLSSPLLHPDPNGIPIHGVNPSALPFDLLEQSPDRVVAEYTTERSPQALEVFPHPHRLEVAAEVTDSELTIHTTLHALGDPVPVAFGYHPYLCPPGADRSTWEITVPDMPQLELDDRMLPTGASHPAHIDGGPLGGRSFDDAFGPVDDGIAFSCRRRRAHDHRHLPGGLPLRPDLHAAGGTADLLRADGRPHQRAQDRRRAPDAGSGRITHRRIPDRCR